MHVHTHMTQRLQGTNLEDSWASCDGVVSDGGVAAGQNNVSLAGDGGITRGRSWDSDRETSGNSGSSTKSVSN